MTVAVVNPGRAPDVPIYSGNSRNTTTVGWLGTIALLPIIAAHVVGASVVDPVLDPISWYAFVPGGGELIMTAGVVMAVLGLILMVRMYRAGLAVGVVPATAMVLFAIAMILVGAFPTDPPGTAATFSATVHRVSAAAAFCVLPMVGLSLERSIRPPRSTRPRALRRAAQFLGVVVGLFLIIHLSLFAQGSGIVAFGLLERIGFVIMIGYLYLLAATIDYEGPGTGAEAAGAEEIGRETVIPTDLLEPVVVECASGLTLARSSRSEQESFDGAERSLVLTGSRSLDLAE